jgi:mRNA-degrading endonuclease RelE of RelBE toxin-antitoxin system
MSSGYEYAVRLLPTAVRDLRSISPAARRLVAAVIEGLRTEPAPPQHREVAGGGGLRYVLVADRWMVIYRVDSSNSEVVVAKVKDMGLAHRAIRRASRT